MPRPGVANQYAASRGWADGAEFHPFGFLGELRDALLTVLGAGNLPGRPIDRGKIAG